MSAEPEPLELTEEAIERGHIFLARELHKMAVARGGALKLRHLDLQSHFFQHEQPAIAWRSMVRRMADAMADEDYPSSDHARGDG